jgi:hypothetical protein
MLQCSKVSVSSLPSYLDPIRIVDEYTTPSHTESKLAVVDALQGCSIRVSKEPYRGAGFFEEIQGPTGAG